MRLCLPCKRSQRMSSMRNTLIWPYHMVVRTGSISALTRTSAPAEIRTDQLIWYRRLLKLRVIQR